MKTDLLSLRLSATSPKKARMDGFSAVINNRYVEAVLNEWRAWNGHYVGRACEALEGALGNLRKYITGHQNLLHKWSLQHREILHKNMMGHHNSLCKLHEDRARWHDQMHVQRMEWYKDLREADQRNPLMIDTLGVLLAVVITGWFINKVRAGFKVRPTRADV
jgi:hypothetical protein